MDYELVDKQSFFVLNTKFSVIEVPGHTLDHIAFYGELDLLQDNQEYKNQGILFSGDTLFSGGCGRLFEGSAEQMFNSLQKLAALPKTTLVFCAHEYTLNNLKFAQSLMPENKDLEEYIEVCKQKRNQDLPTIPSTLEIELKINPFLRHHDSEIYQNLLNNRLVSKKDDIRIFTAIRKAKDTF